MKLNKNQKIIGILLLTILSIFLTIKYNCEKLHQDIICCSSNGITTSFLVVSKIKHNNLCINVIGPIVKQRYIPNSDISLEVKDKNNVTIGKSIIKSDEIFYTYGKNISFSTIIPNINWRERLFSNLQIGVLTTTEYFDESCVNHNNLDYLNSYNQLGLYQQFYKKFFYKSWLDNFLKDRGESSYALYQTMKLVKSKGVKNKSQLEQVLGEQGLANYKDYFVFDSKNNVKVFINGMEIMPSDVDGESKVDIKRNSNIINTVEQSIKNLWNPKIPEIYKTTTDFSKL